jgi:ribulose-phosphate 3-epimerase
LKPLLLDVSLWSADLANLAGSIARADHLVDSYHLDVSDGHFTPSLLFFPDLVAAIRPLTAKPFHVHLLARKPSDWVNVFAAAGANRIYVHERSRGLMEKIQACGCEPGLAISLDQPLTYMEGCRSILLMATALGIKGVGPAPSACTRIRAMARHLETLGQREAVPIVVDGGVRRETVPAYREAGADGVVPGSLFFGAEDPQTTVTWLRSL